MEIFGKIFTPEHSSHKRKMWNESSTFAGHFICYTYSTLSTCVCYIDILPGEYIKVTIGNDEVLKIQQGVVLNTVNLSEFVRLIFKTPQKWRKYQ